jgi:hypothetical protein
MSCMGELGFTDFTDFTLGEERRRAVFAAVPSFMGFTGFVDFTTGEEPRSVKGSYEKQITDKKPSTEFVLYQKVALYLIAHPTQPETPLKVPVPGMPFDGKVPKPPVVPRGWKMGEILPLHSPALSGPGVTEDVFSQMMEGMGMGGLTGGPSGAPTGAPQIAEKKEKKEKKGKKK